MSLGDLAMRLKINCPVLALAVWLHWLGSDRENNLKLKIN